MVLRHWCHHPMIALELELKDITGLTNRFFGAKQP
jgi:hypothetical protein|tara:strand:- start:770 stop:874 length:105 start_codon:yes stop_codon:yes gene_type:complete